MGVEMSDPWVWCTCTMARLWGESMASSPSWLAASVATAGDDATAAAAVSEASTPGTESRSASYGAARGSILDTTTTRIPALSSATRSW